MEPVSRSLPEYVLTQILETAFQWFVVVDEESRILYINEDYCRFLQVSREEAIGKPVDEIIENTRMHEVVRTGEQHIASPHFIKGTYMLANRVPLIVDGKIVGAFGSVIFRDLNDWHHLSSHVKQTLDKIHIGSVAPDGSSYRLSDIRGSSDAIRSIKETIQMIAPSDLPVLIQGESGTGKELFAHSIHQLSDRSEQPLIKVNCAAIPSDLLEAELFGYSGSSTSHDNKGRIHSADGGTLFLDDIGNLPLPVQVKLLRVLNEGELESLATHQTQKINIRVIATTNQNLTDLIESGQFREDLYYRIQTITLQVPPLRERMEDFPEILSFLFHEAVNKAGKRNLGFAQETMDYLQSYHWPGNIRELQNVIQAAVYLSNGETIYPNALPPQVKKGNKIYSTASRTLAELMEEVERSILMDTLSQYPNKREAATVLGLSKSTFYEKIKKYEL